MESYTLPDGRQPLRFGKGRTAYYAKLRGAGEVCYAFSMIKYMINHRPRLTPEEVSEVARKRAVKLKQKDPQFFNKIGTKGGKVTKKDGGEDGEEQKSQRNEA